MTKYTTPTSGAVPVEFLRGVIALCTQRGYSPENIEAWSTDDKWIADLWRQAAQMLAAAPAQPAAQQGAAYAATPTSNYAGRVYEEGFLIGTCPLYTADQLRAFADATYALRASHGQAYPTIGDLCARIKAADDAAADRDYMLDSDDCIAVLRGEWKGPLTMDKPERAAHGQAPDGATSNGIPVEAGIAWQEAGTGIERKAVMVSGRAWYRDYHQKVGPPANSARYDAELLDWIEEQARKSPTGISFDWVRHAEEGAVLEQGYRFMRRHFLGERKATLRAAIQAARTITE